MSDIHNFFEKCAEFSIGGTPSDIAEFYGKNFVVVGPTESMAFANNDDFLKWLKSVQDFNNQTGLEKLMVRNVTSTFIGKHAVQATVTWGVMYGKTKDEIIEFDIHYFLENFTSTMKIILYISDDDQEQLMRENGLLEY